LEAPIIAAVSVITADIIPRAGTKYVVMLEVCPPEFVVLLEVAM